MKIGILGGTFDPIHSEHLKMARAARDLLALDVVYLVPSRPWQKTARASDEDRLAMLKIAACSFPSWLKIDTRELDRGGPSYSIDTLYSFRRQFEKDPLVFIMGGDQWANLKTWIQWEKFPLLANLLLFKRSSQLIESPYGAAFPVNEVKTPLKEVSLEGSIYIADIELSCVSSTEIRKSLYSEPARSAKILGLDELVQRYILEHHLYLPREGSRYI